MMKKPMESMVGFEPMCTFHAQAHRSRQMNCSRSEKDRKDLNLSIFKSLTISSFKRRRKSSKGTSANRTDNR